MCHWPRAPSGSRVHQMPELLKSVHPTGPDHHGVADRPLIALVNPERLRRILSKMLDENEFLSPYGIRALSKFHEEHPYVYRAAGQDFVVDYLPGRIEHRHVRRQLQLARPDLDAGQRHLIRALLNFYSYYGDSFKIECPTGSGQR